jgi:hypothetical protein
LCCWQLLFVFSGSGAGNFFFFFVLARSRSSCRFYRDRAVAFFSKITWNIRLRASAGIVILDPFGVSRLISAYTAAPIPQTPRPQPSPPEATTTASDVDIQPLKVFRKAMAFSSAGKFCKKYALLKENPEGQTFRAFDQSLITNFAVGCSPTRSRHG